MWSVRLAILGEKYYKFIAKFIVSKVNKEER